MSYNNSMQLKSANADYTLLKVNYVNEIKLFYSCDLNRNINGWTLAQSNPMDCMPNTEVAILLIRLQHINMYI